MAYKTKPSMVQSNTDQSKETDSEKLNFEVETEDKHAETQAVNWPLDEGKYEEEEQEEVDYVLAQDRIRRWKKKIKKMKKKKKKKKS